MGASGFFPAVAVLGRHSSPCPPHCNRPLRGAVPLVPRERREHRERSGSSLYALHLSLWLCPYANSLLTKTDTEQTRPSASVRSAVAHFQLFPSCLTLRAASDTTRRRCRDPAEKRPAPLPSCPRPAGPPAACCECVDLEVQSLASQLAVGSRSPSSVALGLTPCQMSPSGSRTKARVKTSQAEACPL